MTTTATQLAAELEYACPFKESLERSAAAELRRLSAEVVALRKDAERYRWLRERYQILTNEMPAKALGLDLRRLYVNTREKFDTAIDAAMKGAANG
jgi:hypothetical protein